VLGVDTSKGMIAKFNSKKVLHPNLEGLVLLLERREQIKEYTEGRYGLFDLVLSHLVSVKPRLANGQDELRRMLGISSHSGHAAHHSSSLRLSQSRWEAVHHGL